jgi:drug/metabolite transporter (DMT)-like permease
LVSALFYAGYVVYLDIATHKINYFLLVYMQVITTAALAFIISSILSVTGIEKASVTFSNSLIFGLAYTSILATIITMILQTKYQKEVTPAKAGIIFSFEPIFAAVFAFFILNERLYKFGIIGCILIFSGLLISELIEREKKETADKW